MGELCSYIETQSSNAIRENCGNLTAYTSLLMLVGSCSNGNGNPGRLVWTPDANTPDVVYYQVCNICVNTLLAMQLDLFDLMHSFNQN